MANEDTSRIGARIEAEYSFINSSSTEETPEKTSIFIEGSPELPAILIIDDNKHVVEIMAKTLAAEQYTIYASIKGDEGLGFFKKYKERISLVIIDECMPDYSGLELLDLMRKQKSDLQAILTSGYYYDDEPRPLLDSRFATFLPKPFDLNSLLAMAKVRLKI